MKFQINIEVDETETDLSQKEIVNYVIDSLVESLEKLALTLMSEWRLIQL